MVSFPLGPAEDELLPFSLRRMANCLPAANRHDNVI